VTCEWLSFLEDPIVVTDMDWSSSEYECDLIKPNFVSKFCAYLFQKNRIMPTGLTTVGSIKYPCQIPKIWKDNVMRYMTLSINFGNISWYIFKWRDIIGRLICHSPTIGKMTMSFTPSLAHFQIGNSSDWWEELKLRNRIKTESPLWNPWTKTSRRETYLNSFLINRM
jgi:hypothetical protein